MLTIKDLSPCLELDLAAMAAVYGAGLGFAPNQSIRQTLNAITITGTGSLFGGPTDIRVNNAYSQSASLGSSAFNLEALLGAYHSLGQLGDGLGHG